MYLEIVDMVGQVVHLDWRMGEHARSLRIMMLIIIMIILVIL